MNRIVSGVYKILVQKYISLIICNLISKHKQINVRKFDLLDYIFSNSKL